MATEAKNIKEEAPVQKDTKEIKSKSELGMLDEDDEFEEFPIEEWGQEAEDKGDLNVWEDNWDDDQAEDDFSVQLKAELTKQEGRMET